MLCRHVPRRAADTAAFAFPRGAVGRLMRGLELLLYKERSGWNKLEVWEVESRMGRVPLYILSWASGVLGLVCAVWLVAVALLLLRTGGTYSQSFEDGSLACGIPVFTEGGWFWPAFSLFGAPSILLAACVRTVEYCSRRLRAAGRSGGAVGRG